MATIRKRGDTWQAQVRRNSKTISRTFKQKSAAQKWAQQVEQEAAQFGFTGDHACLSRLRVADVLERFRDTVVPQRHGRKIETFVINAFLRHRISQTRLSNITPGHFAAYRDERLKVVQPGTVIRELGLIQHVFEVARIDWNIPFAVNPVRAIRKPKAGRPRNRRLSAEDWQRLDQGLMECRNPLIEKVVSFAIATGMRRGEILNAKWGEVSCVNRTLHVPVTKTGEPRTIPLSSEAMALLESLRSSGASPDDRVFPTSPEAVKLAWQRLTKRAGIQDLHFHDLRHEAVSRFFERGLSVPEVALISGHKDPRMLFRYTHLKAEDVARKLNGAV
ncbi:MAG TPA: site-specific integrase [Rhizomicrobium sp.]|nr:site-specific integrase [Rhizomicrobium sp.]